MVKNSLGLKGILSAMICLLAFTLAAQNSRSNADFTELEAFESFQARKYQSVISNLSDKTTQTDNEEILLLLSELKAGKSDEKEVSNWLDTNQKHPIRPLVEFHLGEYYFYSQDTLNSKRLLSNLDANDLSTPDRASYGFIFGVLQLDDKKHQNAISLFQFARKNGFNETQKLDYYESFAYYHLDDREKALEGFKKSLSNEEYTVSAKFFIAKIQLENGEVDSVIELSKSELSDERSVTNSGFYQLIGEAYASKNDVAKADAYFERAIQVHPGKPTAALYYQAGISKFRIGNEDQAIEYLTAAGIQGGTYAQLSAFQLGRLYLKKHDYQHAHTAYVEASASDDEVMKKEAYFQLAHISAQLKNYTDAINYGIDYLNQFKGSSQDEAIQNLIAQSYLRTSNYDLAISHLKETGITNKTQQEVYQKVTFQKALLTFNDGNFSEAKSWFSESLQYTLNASLKDQSYFHLGEISSRNGKFEEALSYYKKQSSKTAETHYGMGYAFYNQQKYQEAISPFRKAKTSADTRVQMDANIRLADCLFATKSFEEALDTYQQAGNRTNAPYIQYQKGMTLRALGEKERAVDAFKKVFNAKTYSTKARYEVAMIYFEKAEFKKAEEYFSSVLESPSATSLTPQSLLNRGIARKNLNKLEAAKSDYSEILVNHISSDAALNAILGLQELQQAGVSVSNLDKYLADYKKANPENGSLEVIEFESAKRLYFDFEYAQAAKAFQQYLKEYPNSSNRIETHYYLGDSYYRIDDLANSKEAFESLKYLKNTYTGRVLTRLGDINQRLGDVDEAIETYQLLLDLDLTPKDTYNARKGLLSTYYASGQFANAVQTADEILKSEWKPLNAEQEANLLKARSQMKMEQIDMARRTFTQLSTGSDSYAAEANYWLGWIAYEKAEYEASLNILFELNSKFGSYGDWVDKSYLLIAKNYIEMEELFQAKATLRSIIQHANNELVKEEAAVLLSGIETNANPSDTTESKG